MLITLMQNCVCVAMRLGYSDDGFFMGATVSALENGNGIEFSAEMVK